MRSYVFFVKFLLEEVVIFVEVMYLYFSNIPLFAPEYYFCIICHTISVLLKSNFRGARGGSSFRCSPGSRAHQPMNICTQSVVPFSSTAYPTPSSVYLSLRILALCPCEFIQAFMTASALFWPLAMFSPAVM